METTTVKSDNVAAAAKPAPEVQEERLNEQDKHVLDIMILSHKNSVLSAEKAIAESKASEANYKLGLLSLYRKYNLDVERDAVDEQGVIKRNAVSPQGSK